MIYLFSSLVKMRLNLLKDLSKRKILPLAIFSALPSDQLMRVFAPAPIGFRKVRNVQFSNSHCIWLRR